MRYYTHIIFALFLGTLFNPYIPNKILFFTVLAFSSLIPDIDTASSYIGKKIRPFSWFIEFFLGHRRFFHSLIFVLIVSLIIALFNFTLSFAFFLGSFSHLILDGLTREGIMLFYPAEYRFKGVFKTGGLAEHLVFVALIIMILLVTGHYIL